MNIIYHKGFPFLVLCFLISCGASFVYINLGRQVYLLRGYFRTFLGLFFMGLSHCAIWGSVLWFMTSSKPFPFVYPAIGAVLLFILSLLDPWLTPDASEEESLDILMYYWDIALDWTKGAIFWGILIFIVNYVGDQFAIENEKKDLEYARSVEKMEQALKELREIRRDRALIAERTAALEREKLEFEAGFEGSQKGLLVQAEQSD